ERLDRRPGGVVKLDLRRLPTGEQMSDDESREWNFQLNLAGLTLLLFASGYIGQHLALLLPLSGWPRVLVHYSGELVLTALAVGAAMWKAYGASEPHRVGSVG